MELKQATMLNNLSSSSAQFFKQTADAPTPQFGQSNDPFRRGGQQHSWLEEDDDLDMDTFRGSDPFRNYGASRTSGSTSGRASWRGGNPKTETPEADELDTETRPSRTGSLGKRARQVVGGLLAATLAVLGVDHFILSDRSTSSSLSAEVQEAQKPVQDLLAAQTRAVLTPEIIGGLLDADIRYLQAAGGKTSEIEALQQKRANLPQTTEEVVTQLSEDIKRRYVYAGEKAGLSPADSTALTWAILTDPSRIHNGGLSGLLGSGADDKVFLPAMDRYAIALTYHNGKQDLAASTLYNPQGTQQANGIPESAVTKNFVKRFTDARTLLQAALNEESKKQLADETPALSDMALRLAALEGTPQVQQSAFANQNKQWSSQLMEALAQYYDQPGDKPGLDPALLDPAVLVPAAMGNAQDPYNFAQMLEKLNKLKGSAPENAKVVDFLTASEFGDSFPNAEALARSQNAKELNAYARAQGFKNQLTQRVQTTIKELALPQNPLEEVVEE